MTYALKFDEASGAGPTPVPEPSFGSEVRQLRRARNMTLRDLADASGVSLSHLSAIERGATSPTLEKIERIARGLRVATEWFFASRPGAGPNERACVVRAGNRRNLHLLYAQTVEEAGYEDRLLSATIGGNLSMGIASYAPRSETVIDYLYRNDGETHGLVLEGDIEMVLGDETVVLSAGDSFSVPGNLPHRARNRRDAPATIVWASSPVIIPLETIMHSEDTNKNDVEGERI